MNNNNKINLQDYITNINEKLMMRKPVDSIKEQQETLKQHKDKFASDIYSEVYSVIGNQIISDNYGICAIIYCDYSYELASMSRELNFSTYTEILPLPFTWEYLTCFANNIVILTERENIIKYDNNYRRYCARTREKPLPFRLINHTEIIIN